MTEDGGTFLEEFINSTELLPNDIRRNSELMRELDKDSTGTAKEIEAAEVGEGCVCCMICCFVFVGHMPFQLDVCLLTCHMHISTWKYILFLLCYAMSSVL